VQQEYPEACLCIELRNRPACRRGQQVLKPILFQLAVRSAYGSALHSLPKARIRLWNYSYSAYLIRLEVSPPERRERWISHVLLVQEPRLFSERDRRITKKHPSFECFSPVDTFENTPRVMTYVRRGVGLRATQERLLPQEDEAANDLLFLTVRTSTNQVLTTTTIAPLVCKIQLYLVQHSSTMIFYLGRLE
jgi:hypothetical protein